MALVTMVKRDRGCIKHNNIQFIFNKNHHFACFGSHRRKLNILVDKNKNIYPEQQARAKWMENKTIFKY